MIGSCRFCNTPLTCSFIDLNVSPLANSYLTKDDLNSGEIFYPLHTYVCSSCFLVQLQQYESPQELFNDYAYFSSFSDSWLEHAKQYVKKAIDKFNLTDESFVVEIASNDGYLLQYFKEDNIPVLGIEPAQNVAEKAINKGITTKVDFFSEYFAEELLKEGYQADLIIANNVLAHVPDLMDFVAGLKYLLKPKGIITIEVPHLLQLITHIQFDTIYHEHFSYFSLFVLDAIFASKGLRITDVEELPTHGGSLRIYIKHADDGHSSQAVHSIIKKEIDFGLQKLQTYSEFSHRVQKLKNELLHFLRVAKEEDKEIVGYGAPAKGNTLLNFCGIGKEFITYTVDRNPVKQGLFLPGSRIPIKSVEEISLTKPDYVLILPWNLKEEVINQMDFIREWGGRFVIANPQVEVI